MVILIFWLCLKKNAVLFMEGRISPAMVGRHCDEIIDYLREFRLPPSCIRDLCSDLCVGWWLPTFRDISYPSSKVKQSISCLTASPLKMKPIGCLETLVTNHRSKLCNIPEERIPHSMICFISEDEGKGREIVGDSAASSSKTPCVIVANLIRKNRKVPWECGWTRETRRLS